LSAYYKKKQEAPTEVQKASTPAELLMEQYFIPFLVNYIKDLKADGISIIATPEVVELMD